MGEIADMMLDGTMDQETGEFNFDGADGPGWPMTAAEAAAYKRADRMWKRDIREAKRAAGVVEAPFHPVSKRVRAKIEKFGDLRNNDAFHWQVRKDGKVVADWWPHKSKFRIGGKMFRGNDDAFVRALAKAAEAAT